MSVTTVALIFIFVKILIIILTTIIIKYVDKKNKQTEGVANREGIGI
jgi:heme/copper-type cytochrome/quinol oxidase subunit 2